MLSTRLSYMLLCLLVGSGLASPARADEKPTPTPKAQENIKEIAGSAEFLRTVPKRYGLVQSVEPTKKQIVLQFEGEKEPSTWSLTPDAEIKVHGWWGRLEQFQPGQRVWTWLKVDRAKKPTALFMLADELSEQDIHGGAKVKTVGQELILEGPKKSERKFSDLDKLTVQTAEEKCCEAKVLKPKDVVYVETKAGKVSKLYDQAGLETLRTTQKQWLRQRWLTEGLPGTVGFLHVYSGEVDLLLDHEAMRWGRSLQAGTKVELLASPHIKAVVKSMQAQREKTQIRLVVASVELSELAVGQRLSLKMPALDPKIENDVYPPDIEQPTSKADRIEWFLANTYCTCGVANDVCTGHFYTLASCNPNSCAAPINTKKLLNQKIDAGLTNRQIFEELLKERGTLMLRPHLLP